MSTALKRSRAEAIAEAARLQQLLGDTVLRWEIAGSVRRMRPEVGDVDHVVIPSIVTEPLHVQAPMFGEVLDKPRKPTARNLMLARLDELVDAGELVKAVHSDGKNRWGPKYRTVVLPGQDPATAFKHELWSASEGSWGAILSIRTGPEEISERLVKLLRERGFKQHEGELRRLLDAGHWDEQLGKRVGEVLGEVLTVPEERDYFAIAGLPWCEPEKRDAVAEHIRRAKG